MDFIKILLPVSWRGKNTGKMTLIISWRGQSCNWILCLEEKKKKKENLSASKMRISEKEKKKKRKLLWFQFCVVFFPPTQIFLSKYLLMLKCSLKSKYRTLLFQVRFFFSFQHIIFVSFERNFFCCFLFCLFLSITPISFQVYRKCWKNSLFDWHSSFLLLGY